MSDYDNWNTQKKRLNTIDHRPPYREGQVWWASLGLNVGIEVNGKNELFTRPVVIVKRLSTLGCIVVPLTTQLKEEKPEWYYQFTFNERVQFAGFAQLKTISTKRLTKQMGELSSVEFKKLKEALQAFLG